MIGVIAIVGVLVWIFVVLLKKELEYHKETKENCMWRIVPMVGIVYLLIMILMGISSSSRSREGVDDNGDADPQWGGY